MNLEEEIIAALPESTGHLEMIEHRPEALDGRHGGDVNQIVLPVAHAIVLEVPERPGILQGKREVGGRLNEDLHFFHMIGIGGMVR